MRKGYKRQALVCRRCGAVDKSGRLGPIYCGTDVEMRCADCTVYLQAPVNEQLATLCRGCCPTGHGTHAVNTQS